MRILFIPYGTENAPATRYRVMQYMPYLKKSGIGYSVFPAISRLSTNIMIKSPDFNKCVKYIYYIYVLIERIIRFCYILSISATFDIIFLQRSTFPLGFERLLKIVNDNIIFDIDDAIYMPDKEEDSVIGCIKRYIKKTEVANMLKVSKAVVVENDYIKDFVSRYCKNILKIPGPIDTQRFLVRHKTERSDEVVIGWIGSPATTFYLHMLDDIFNRIEDKYHFIKFRFIGLGRYENPDIQVKRLKWDYETEVDNLQTFDIGVMPMPDNDWTRGKLGCKMLQYMAVGIPAVVSYTPTNAEIIKDGENGYFARSGDEWMDKMSRLIESPDLRESVGSKGRATIEERCSLQKNFEELLKIFVKVKDGE